MSAFYFGSSDRPLFGFYHPPADRPVRRAGVLLCNALGKEYLRTHRTLRQLALRLTEAGYHVLRFDYSGTGDSAGEGREATLRRWEEDGALAADELKAVAGVRRMTVVGVRLGGAVAAALASERTDVDDLVLWDPVVRGDRYLTEVLEEDERRAPGPVGGAGAGEGPRGGPGPSPDGSREPEPRPDRASRATAPVERGDRGAPPDGRGPDVVGAGGFPLGRAMREEIASLRLDELDRLGARRTLLVTTDDREAYRALGERLDDLAVESRIEQRPGAEGWEDPGRMGTVVLVPAVVGAIVDFLDEEDR